MIIIKDGVKIAGLDSRMQHALSQALDIYENQQVDLVITRALDIDDVKSKYSKGLAFDIRTGNLNPGTIYETHAILVHRLSALYDVTLEKNYIHIEWEPK